MEQISTEPVTEAGEVGSVDPSGWPALGSASPLTAVQSQ